MIASPQIRTPTSNQQFNLGTVSITWDPIMSEGVSSIRKEDNSTLVIHSGLGIASQIYLDSPELLLTLKYLTDVTADEWLEIQSWFEDGASGGAYSGTGTSSYGNEIGPWLESNGIILNGNFTVEEIDNQTGDYFIYLVKDLYNVYQVSSYSSSGNDNRDIAITLVYSIQYVDSEDITYEIEYTDNYKEDETNWHSVKRRIPSTDSSYTWNVGKMIKSNSVRVRMRSRYSITEEVSSWSISESFSINVFKLTAPAIVSPISGNLYTNFILVILDETLTLNTYHQKVRYTLEYASAKQNAEWTEIVSNVPVGHNIIRWNIEGVASSDDYTLRLTAKNNSTSCTDESSDEPDQISRSFVHNIVIQQSGMFLIDTVPPDAVVEIGGNDRVTNQLNQIVNIFAEDATTEVKQIQLRECNATSSLVLGNLENESAVALQNAITEAIAQANSELENGTITEDEYETRKTELVGEATAIYGSGCESIENLLASGRGFDKLITDAPLGNSTKIQWVFDPLDAEGNPVSAVKKIEALLSDVGGNTSIQRNSKIFLSIFNSSDTINDFVIVVEQRDSTVFDNDGTINTETATYESLYAGSSAGELWVIDPFPRYIYTVSNHPNIQKLYEYNDSIYLYAYNSGSHEGALYRHDGSFCTVLNTFSNGSITGIAEYDDSLFIGLESGELWEYNGFSFSLKTTFTESINTIFSDNNYMYIGFQNSSVITLYNGSIFSPLEVE